MNEQLRCHVMSQFGTGKYRRENNFQNYRCIFERQLCLLEVFLWDLILMCSRRAAIGYPAERSSVGSMRVDYPAFRSPLGISVGSSSHSKDKARAVVSIGSSAGISSATDAPSSANFRADTSTRFSSDPTAWL
jgi:hypothetical protein